MSASICRTSILAATLVVCGTGWLPAQAEMPKPQFGIKVSNPQPIPRNIAAPGNTAVLNNQTFSVPKSVVVSPAEARRARVLSVLPKLQGQGRPAPARNNNSLVLTNTTFSVPTSVTTQAAKPAPRVIGVVSGRRLTNAPVRRCPGGAWTC